MNESDRNPMEATRSIRLDQQAEAATDALRQEVTEVCNAKLEAVAAILETEAALKHLLALQQRNDSVADEHRNAAFWLNFAAMKVRDCKS